MDNEMIIISQSSCMTDRTYDEQLGQRLKTLREMHRMTQADVGAKIGLSHQQIQKYEKGHSRVRANLAADFARLFNIPLAQLLDTSGVVAPVAVMVQVADAPQEPLVGAPEASAEIVRLVNAFSRILTSQQRAIVLDLAESLAAK
jgi:transcriptional regulator with XRE-family HTH domain